MPGLVVLDGIELIPVLELEPFRFASPTRPRPTGTGPEVELWARYWSDSLADSGLGALRPIRTGSWNVPTTEFADPELLQCFLEVILEGSASIRSFTDPDLVSVLFGGLALRGSNPEVLIEPTCCGDLGNSAEWRTAASYRESAWQMLWIGHPWLSVSYQAPWLILSDFHESNSPTPRWAVDPEGLHSAVVAAEAELERLAFQITSSLTCLGVQGDANLIGRKLAGLSH